MAIDGQTLAGMKQALSGSNTTEAAFRSAMDRLLNQLDSNSVPTVPSGTAMVFYQTAAPTGWTKVTTHNNKALRVVSGSGGGSGGTHNLSSPPSTAHTHSIGAHNHGNTFSSASHTLSVSQMPNHSHSWTYRSDNSGGSGANAYDFKKVLDGDWNRQTAQHGTTSAGGNAAHSHTFSGSVTGQSAYDSGSGAPTAFAPKYTDVIICSKD